jgi:hypothetical protein
MQTSQLYRREAWVRSATACKAWQCGYVYCHYSTVVQNCCLTQTEYRCGRNWATACGCRTGR